MEAAEVVVAAVAEAELLRSLPTDAVVAAVAVAVVEAAEVAAQDPRPDVRAARSCRDFRADRSRDFHRSPAG